MHINELFLLVQKSVTKFLQIHHDLYHNLWLMQIVKSDTYRVLNVAATLYLSICAHQLINILCTNTMYIQIHLFYIQIPILTVVFFCFSSFGHCVFISMRRELGL